MQQDFHHGAAGSQHGQNRMNTDDLGLLGQSNAMDELRDAVRRVAESPYPVLVTGESDR